MKPGQILVANHEGVYVIKLVGDVRLTLCMSFDNFIDVMLSDTSLTSIIFDLTEAEAIDSTTLGLMAKISLLGQENRQVRPVILASNASIQRILETMGFSDIFTIVDELNAPALETHPLGCLDCDEVAIKNKVIEAHRILMSLNESNHETFKSLVSMLEE